MKSTPILTIAIPTFNRASQLDTALSAIHEQISGIEQKLALKVIDNASTDETAQVCAKWRDRLPSFEYVRKVSNTGMAANILTAFEKIDTDFCWISGDDDIIRVGALPQIVAILEADNPDLVYMKGRGFLDVPDQQLLRYEEHLRSTAVSADKFCKLVNVYVTFLTGLIVNKKRLLSESSRDYSRHTWSVFPQLAWVLPLLNEQANLNFVDDEVLLVRGAASGNFDLMGSFSVDFCKILRQELSASMATRIESRTALTYMPAMLMLARLGKAGNFNFSESDPASVKEAYGRHVAYWVLHYPILHLPIAVALPAYYLARCIQVGFRKLDALDLWFSRHLPRRRHRD